MYGPTTFTFTVPLAVTGTGPAQPSTAVAPGSVNVLPCTTVIGLFPFNVITGGVVSLGVNTQPLAGLQLSAVHRLPSSQLSAAWVQPVNGLQVSMVHGLVSAQLSGVPGWQTPP